MASPFPCCPVNRKCHVKEKKEKKMIPSLLVVREVSPFEFLELCCIHLWVHILGPVKHLGRTFLRR